MKKYLLIIALAINAHETKPMDYIVRLKQYIFGNNNTKNVDRLPSLAVFQEFNVDGREFIPELINGNSSPDDFLSTKLQARCSKLHKGEIKSNSVKDTEILKFTKDMVAYEKEWKDWHTIDKVIDDNETKNKAPKKSTSDTTLQKHFLETSYINDANDKSIKIRRDENSPYYQWASTDNSRTVIANLMENEAYHNEFKFLQTQLRKMDLYWNIKPDSEKKLQQQNFEKTRKLLVQEIESFKKNRVPFTHSCLKTKDFEDLQTARNTYQQNKWNELPWYKKIFNYRERSSLNQNINALKDLQQKHEVTRKLKQQRQQHNQQQRFHE